MIKLFAVINNQITHESILAVVIIATKTNLRTFHKAETLSCYLVITVI